MTIPRNANRLGVEDEEQRISTQAGCGFVELSRDGRADGASKHIETAYFAFKPRDTSRKIEVVYGC